MHLDAAAATAWDQDVADGEAARRGWAAVATGECSRCGAARTDGWAFCRACGAVDVPLPRAAADDEVPPAREHEGVAAREAALPMPSHGAPQAATAAPSRPHPRPAPGPRSVPGSPVGPRARSALEHGSGPTRVRVPLRGEVPGPRSALGSARSPASLLVGTPRDWLAALAAAAATLAVLAVPGAVLAVVAGSEAPTGAAVSPLVLVPVAIALGVGGSVSVQLDLGGLGGLDSAVAAVPLLATGAAVATGAALVVGDTRRAADVPAQALRGLVVFLVGLAAVALTGRATTGGGTIAVALAPTLLGGALWFAGALALAIAWRRPDALPPGLRRARDLLAGPTAGVGAVLGSCWLGGLALVVGGVIARAAHGTPVSTLLPPGLPAAASSASSASSGSPTAAVLAVVAVLVFAPTVLLGAFAVCLGVPLTGRGPTGERELALVTLLGDAPSWWLAPLVGAVVCILGGMVAALHAPSPADALRRGWALGPALAVVLALVTVVTAASAGPLGVRLDLAPAVVLGLGWGVAGGLLGAVIAPGMPAGLRQGRLGESAAGRVVGVLVVVALLGAALVIGFTAAAGAA